MRIPQTILEIHGITGQLLPRKCNKASETSVAVDLNSDVEAQHDSRPEFQRSMPGDQQMLGERQCQGETLERAAEDMVSQPKTISEYLTEDDSNLLVTPQDATNRERQDVRIPLDESGNHPKVYAPQSFSSCEASHFHSLDNDSSDASSGWEDMSEDEDSLSEMYVALTRRLDAELDDVDRDIRKLNFLR